MYRSIGLSIYMCACLQIHSYELSKTANCIFAATDIQNKQAQGHVFQDTDTNMHKRIQTYTQPFIKPDFWFQLKSSSDVNKTTTRPKRRTLASALSGNFVVPAIYRIYITHFRHIGAQMAITLFVYLKQTNVPKNTFFVFVDTHRIRPARADTTAHSARDVKRFDTKRFACSFTSPGPQGRQDKVRVFIYAFHL